MASVNRGLLSSLSRRPRRSLPTSTSSSSPAPFSLLNCRHHSYRIPPHPSRHLLSNKAACRGNHSIRCYYHYPITRNLRHPSAGETKFSPAAAATTSTSSARFFASPSFVDRLKKKAEDTAKSVAKKASKTVQTTAEKATETAQKAVSNTLESTQKAAIGAKDEAVRRVSQKASEAAVGVTKATSEALHSTVDGAKKQLSKAATGVTNTATKQLSKSTQAAKEQLSKTASDVTNSATEKISKSTEGIRGSVEETARAATTKAEGIAESSRQLKENLTTTGAKLVRWFWWWSLAAIFVYGVASTLPMAIIKYTMEQKKKSVEEKISKATTAGMESDQETTPAEPTIDTEA